jgi:hypothetical protein
VIIFTNEYNDRIYSVINETKFKKNSLDPTKINYKEMNQKFNNCSTITNKRNTWKLININPIAPIIKGLMKTQNMEL